MARNIRTLSLSYLPPYLMFQSWILTYQARSSDARKRQKLEARAMTERLRKEDRSNFTPAVGAPLPSIFGKQRSCEVPGTVDVRLGRLEGEVVDPVGAWPVFLIAF